MYRSSILLVLLGLSAALASPSQPEAAQSSGSAPSQSQSIASNSPVTSDQSVPSSTERQASQHLHQLVHQHHQVNQYSPAGLVTLVGEQPSTGSAGKPARFEQYGQPEPASLPAGYKPFGSWGLYIGGNPADGYYTNYYKALSNSVDKQQNQPQTAEPTRPTSSGNQVSAFAPLVRNAISSPLVGADYYPFVYSPAELSSISRVSLEAASAPVDPVYGFLSYTDSYKKSPASGYKPENTHKSYQARLYGYPALASAPSATSVGQQPAQQVVAYPVPVGSQIVGSQPGVDGAFSPYGIHAFTRYAVKPTAVVSHEPSYYYQNVHTPLKYSPSYKQSSSTSSSQSSSSDHSSPLVDASPYPLSFYGFPLNALQYSQGGYPMEVSHSYAAPVQMDPFSDNKADKSDEKPLLPQQN